MRKDNGVLLHLFPDSLSTNVIQQKKNQSLRGRYWSEQKDKILNFLHVLRCGETSTEKMVSSRCGRLCGSLLLILISHHKTCKMPACEDTIRLRLLIPALEKSKHAVKRFQLAASILHRLYRHFQTGKVQPDII